MFSTQDALVHHRQLWLAPIFGIAWKVVHWANFLGGLGVHRFQVTTGIEASVRSNLDIEKLLIGNALLPVVERLPGAVQGPGHFAFAAEELNQVFECY